MQSRLFFRPLTHRRDLLVFRYFLTFLDQQRGVVPVGTQVSVIMFDDDKLTICSKSTPGVHDLTGRRCADRLPRTTGNQNTAAGARSCAEFHGHPATRRPRPGQCLPGRGSRRLPRFAICRGLRRPVSGRRRQPDDLTRMDERSVTEPIPAGQFAGVPAVSKRNRMQRLALANDVLIRTMVPARTRSARGDQQQRGHAEKATCACQARYMNHATTITARIRTAQPIRSI